MVDRTFDEMQMSNLHQNASSSSGNGRPRLGSHGSINFNLNLPLKEPQTLAQTKALLRANKSKDKSQTIEEKYINLAGEMIFPQTRYGSYGYNYDKRQV